jgi:hypothetical protein
VVNRQSAIATGVGARLMRSASPQGWEQIAEGSKSEAANRDALKICARTVDRTGKQQCCVIMANVAYRVTRPEL